MLFKQVNRKTLDYLLNEVTELKPKHYSLLNSTRLCHGFSAFVFFCNDIPNNLRTSKRNVYALRPNSCIPRQLFINICISESRNYGSKSSSINTS